MSFGSAFGYPYKNLPKIATIVLGFTLLIAVMVAMAVNSRSSDGILLLTAAIVIAQSLFLTGYGIRVVRHVMDGHEESMPNIEIMSDIGRGIVVSFAGFLTLLPVFIIAVCMMMSIFPMNVNTSPTASPPNTGAICLFLIVILPLMVYFALGYIVAMIRYADTEESSAMFQFGTNFGYVNSNAASSIGYIFYIIVLAIIYGIGSTIVTEIYNSTITNSLTFRSDQNVVIAVLTVGYILSISFGMLQQFTNFHLMAQFAEQIGISRQTDSYEKMKY